MRSQNTHNDSLRGVFPVLATPFDDQGAIDEASQRRLIRFCMDAGVSGVVHSGLASEFQNLSDDERRRLAELVIEEVAGRMPVVLGTGAPTTRTAIELSVFAEKAGAAALVVMPPYVRAASTAELHEYYHDVAGAVNIPIVIQDATVPYCGGLTVDLIVELEKESPNILYVKEEGFNAAAKIRQIAERTEGRMGILSGYGNFHALSDLRRGCTAITPACDMPEVFVDLFRHYEQSDMEGCWRIYQNFLPYAVFRSQSFVKISKEVLRRRGVIKTSYVRLPDEGSLLDPLAFEMLGELLRRVGIEAFD